MNITTITSRELNQDVGRAKRAARQGPVFITDRGRPAHVLLSIQEYRRLTDKGARIADLLALSEAETAELEIRRQRDLPEPADLS